MTVDDRRGGNFPKLSWTFCAEKKWKCSCAACTSAAHAEQAVAPEVKLDPEANVEQAEVESGPEIKQEPFTIRGHFGLDRIRLWDASPGRSLKSETNGRSRP